MSATCEQFEAIASPSAGSLSMDQTCRVLKISRRTLYYWIRRGRLQTLRTRMGSQRVLIESLREVFLKQQ